jgi:hypothetical protein
MLNNLMAHFTDYKVKNSVFPEYCILYKGAKKEFEKCAETYFNTKFKKDDIVSLMGVQVYFCSKVPLGAIILGNDVSHYPTITEVL